MSNGIVHFIMRSPRRVSNNDNLIYNVAPRLYCNVCVYCTMLCNIVDHALDDLVIYHQC